MRNFLHKGPVGKSRRPRRRSKAVLPALLVLGMLALLFAMALGANTVEHLRSERTRLLRQHSFERDEHRRLLAQYLQATCRERVVPRAMAELDMIEPGPRDKILVALPPAEITPRQNGWLEQFAQGLDRYGEIRGASAGEEAR